MIEHDIQNGITYWHGSEFYHKPWWNMEAGVLNLSNDTHFVPIQWEMDFIIFRIKTVSDVTVFQIFLSVCTFSRPSSALIRDCVFTSTAGLSNPQRDCVNLFPPSMRLFLYLKPTRFSAFEAPRHLQRCLLRDDPSVS